MQRIVKYLPILRQLQQLVLHILDPFMVFTKLIMIRNRTKITILILDFYLVPFFGHKMSQFFYKKRILGPMVQRAKRSADQIGRASCRERV